MVPAASTSVNLGHADRRSHDDDDDDDDDYDDLRPVFKSPCFQFSSRPWGLDCLHAYIS